MKIKKHKTGTKKHIWHLPKYREFNWKSIPDAQQAYASAYNVCNVPQIGVDTGNDLDQLSDMLDF